MPLIGRMPSFSQPLLYCSAVFDLLDDNEFFDFPQQKVHLLGLHREEGALH